MKEKILLAGLSDDTNYGDKIIHDCVRYILDEKSNSFFEVIYLFPKLNVIDRFLRKIVRCLFGVSFLYFDFLSLQYKIKFKTKIKSADKIVFVGGGLIKWKNQFFGPQINAIIKLAEHYKKPIFFNSVGVEDFDDNDIRCKYYVKILTSNIIKTITTRDDILLLNKKYISNKNITTLKVADPAIFTRKVYNIEKKDSNVIGIGLIRGNIFIDNGINFSSEQLLNLYIQLIKTMLDKGREVILFTNGLEQDLEFTNAICESTGFNKNSIYVPSDSKELVEIISGFSFVFAARLHACIISYSLDIPAVGLCWNNKLKIFGETINCSDRFIDINNFSNEYAYDQLLKYEMKSYDQQFREKYEKSLLSSMDAIIGR